MGQLDTVHSLIKTYEVNKEAEDDDGYTALHYASENGHYKLVKYLIGSHVNKKAQNIRGWTALHCASYKGHMRTVKYLIDKCQFDCQAKATNGQTASDLALMHSRVNIVQYLEKETSKIEDKKLEDDSEDNDQDQDQVRYDF